MGERTLFFKQVADRLAERYPQKRIPRRQMPDWAVRLYGLFDRDVRGNLGELGLAKQLDSAGAGALLGRKVTPAPEILTCVPFPS